MNMQHLCAALILALLLPVNGQSSIGAGAGGDRPVADGDVEDSVVPRVVAKGYSFPPIVKPEDLTPCGEQSDDACQDGEICARNVLSNDENDGVCAIVPVGGVAVPADSSKFPHPVGYFPLSGGSTSSWPLRHYSGFQRNVSWIPDSKFGTVAHCKQDENSLIILPSVPFGHDGGLTVNLWLKKDNTTSLAGNAFQYLFSVSSLVNNRFAEGRWELSNQMHIYIPESPHAAGGLMRVLFQDSDDGGSTYYMDSDGEVGRSLFAADANPNHSKLDDGEWHMITVTTLPEEKDKGFRIYVDGALAAETPAGEGAHGGHPIFADGDIFLCGRTDHDPDRHFDGALTQLSLYDESLTSVQIKQLYDLVASEGTVKKKGLDYARELAKETVDISDEDLTQAVTQDGTSDVNQFRIEHFAVRSKYCRGSKFCGDDEQCAAMHSSISETVLEAANQDEDTGICARIPKGGLPISKALAEVPLPLAFFPLTGGDTRSWPVPQFAGVPIRLGLRDDDVFGSVYHCSQKNLSMLAIDNIQFGQSGTFALNIWFRATNLTGHLFQYLVSLDEDMGASRTVWGEQLNVYLGEVEHVLFGLVRTVFKDEDDANGEMYVDSDGLIGVTQVMKRTPSVKVQDGNWHMYTFTTNPAGEKGFRAYVDGKIAAKVDAKELAGAGFRSVGVPGGDPFTPRGPLLLCGRQDLHPERHFEGDIAHLTLYDEDLTDEAVLGIYNSIPHEKLVKSREENLQPTYPPAAHPSSLFPTIPILPIEAIPLGADQLPEGQALTPTGPSSQPIAVGNPAVPLGSLPPQGVGPAVRPEDISPTAASVGNPQEVPIDSADPSVKPPPSQGTPQASSGSELQPAVPIIPESPRRLPAEGLTQTGGAPDSGTQPAEPAVPVGAGTGVRSGGTPAAQAAPSQTEKGGVDDLD